MVTPRGIGSGKGNGLTGLVIMAMARVWLTCVLWPLSSLAGVGAGRGVGRACCDEVDPERKCPPMFPARPCCEELDAERKWPPVVPERIDMRGKFELPGRGFVEFWRRGVEDMVTKVMLVKKQQI